MNPWLGARRGFLSDWTTQQWVRATGRRVDLATASWLRGPCATPTGVRESDFERYAAEQGLDMVPSANGDSGLLDDFAALRSERFDPARVRPEVADFYLHTTRSAWLRHRLPDREVLYAALSTVVQPPLAAGPCVKVVRVSRSGRGPGRIARAGLRRAPVRRVGLLLRRRARCHHRVGQARSPTQRANPRLPGSVRRA